MNDVSLCVFEGVKIRYAVCSLRIFAQRSCEGSKGATKTLAARHAWRREAPIHYSPVASIGLTGKQTG